jgi:four helix bundle suffix protein
MERPLLPPHGGYRKLRSFQAAQLVYDATVVFCNLHISKKSRTHDQMVQAARSGVQNIAEGSVASGTSKKTEIKLTNVLRQRGLPLWDKACAKTAKVRTKLQAGAFTADKVPLCTPEVAANTLLCLINQASYLLARQLARLEADFLQKGGFTENLYRARTQARRLPSDRFDASDRSDS